MLILIWVDELFLKDFNDYVIIHTLNKKERRDKSCIVLFVKNQHIQ